MFKRINRRAFVSLSIFLFFWVMLITSVLMFVKQRSTPTAMLHTVLGFLLLLMLFWHLKHNFSVLKQYFRPHVRGSSATVNKAMPAAVVLAGCVVALVLTRSQPFLAFYEWGSSQRAGDSAVQQNRMTYLRVDMAPDAAVGVRLQLDLRKGSYFAWPQYALWLETMDGKLIQPLYVTSKLATGNFSTKVSTRNQSLVFTSDPMASDAYNPDKVFDIVYEPDTASERIRPESLPVFLHKLSRQAPQGGSQAPASSSELDAYSGATLTENFLLSTQAQKPLTTPYKVRLEINQSFDFNHYYSSKRFPNDPIYSGDGYSAQPSVVYEAIIDPNASQRYYPMVLVGRGHHSGGDGDLYPDLNNLTTALELIDRVIVEVDGHETNPRKP